MAEHTHSEETERNGGRGVGSVEPWYAGALWVGCLGWQQALWVACWAMNGPLHTGTHWQSIALHHFIKLLVYLFVLLLSARCEREGFLRVRAFRIPVLFLVQSLRLGPDRIGKKRQREREGMRLECQEKEEYSRHIAWRGYPVPRSFWTCHLVGGSGQLSHHRLARDCCNR